MSGRALETAMAVAGIALAGCASPLERREDDLTTAEARWRSAGVQDYTFGFSRSCECLPAATRPVMITVSAGAFVAAAYLDDGTAADTALFRDELTLDRLFASLRRILAQRPAVFAASYEPTLGYPTRVSLDYNLTTADDEAFLTVFNVRPGRAAPHP